MDADAVGSEPLYKFKLRAFGELPVVGELAAMIVEHSTKNGEVKRGHAPGLKQVSQSKIIHAALIRTVPLEGVRRAHRLRDSQSPSAMR